MPKKGEKIYQRKDGRFEARYVKEILPDGKKKYGSVYAVSYQEAKEKRQRLTNNSLYMECEASIHSMTTLSEIIPQWLEQKKKRVKESTLQKYQTIISNHIQPALGTLPLTSIKRQTLEKYAANQLAGGNQIDGGKLSAGTVNDIMCVLGMILEFASVECGINKPKIQIIREERHVMRVLSADEQQQLEKILLSNMDIYKFGVYLALYSGMRIGELCALQWKDIDISDGVICINKTLQRLKHKEKGSYIAISEPKTISSNRVIPLHKGLLPMVKKFQKSDGYALAGSNGKFTEPRLLQKKFKKYIKEAELPDTNFHALRHTFATRCVEMGFELKSLSEILGHSDVKITLNKYVHSSLSLKQKNMDLLKMPTQE